MIPESINVIFDGNSKDNDIQKLKEKLLNKELSK